MMRRGRRWNDINASTADLVIDETPSTYHLHSQSALKLAQTSATGVEPTQHDTIGRLIQDVDDDDDDEEGYSQDVPAEYLEMLLVQEPPAVPAYLLEPPPPSPEVAAAFTSSMFATVVQAFIATFCEPLAFLAQLVHVWRGLLSIFVFGDAAQPQRTGDNAAVDVDAADVEMLTAGVHPSPTARKLCYDAGDSWGDVDPPRLHAATSSRPASPPLILQGEPADGTKHADGGVAVPSSHCRLKLKRTKAFWELKEEHVSAASRLDSDEHAPSSDESGELIRVPSEVWTPELMPGNAQRSSAPPMQPTSGAPPATAPMALDFPLPPRTPPGPARRGVPRDRTASPVVEHTPEPPARRGMPTESAVPPVEHTPEPPPLARRQSFKHTVAATCMPTAASTEAIIIECPACQAMLRFPVPEQAKANLDGGTTVRLECKGCYVHILAHVKQHAA